ncbi:polysaccharide deacetylase family protein [Xylanibacillus composti]|uniref:NodB homology domain-containing protein n=1 Tax=Xylanibacillus composti TaxID=1572762 RepID=A0A8J4H629_9BACL|nr:polysaccharide deacetylase family protein [Xylanibacillus composti]GIQ70246.1 hypothetical protein XYCOK13_30700 [Xylanibacillus composti]
MKALLLILVIVYVAGYCLIPYLYSRVLSPCFGWRFPSARFARTVYSLLSGRRAVALTFDDGPDPVYTPKLLDLLAANHISATFFVVGQRASRHPDLIRRIAAEGHEIGIHNYRHWPNWLLAPWSVDRHLQRTASMIHEQTGRWPKLYRPPWGLLNLADLFRSRYRHVLWSVMVNDWRAKAETVTAMQRQLSQHVADGSIIVLHDCGSTFGARPDAPRYMLEALEGWLRINRNKWTFVTLSEGIALDADRQSGEGGAPAVPCSRTQAVQPRPKSSARRRIRSAFAAAWLTWDSLVLHLLRICPIDSEQPFIQARVRPYTGKQALRLDDGTEVRKGDYIAEIHLNNRMIYSISQAYPSMMQLIVALLRRFQPGLPRLAAYIRKHPKAARIKAVYGVSLLHQPAERFGFTVLALPDGLFMRMTRWYLRLVQRLLQPGRPRLRRSRERLEPKIMAMSSNKLLHLYPDKKPGEFRQPQTKQKE